MELRTSTDQLPKTNPRLLGLDQARAVAIIAMMVFHFAPGVFKQLPKLERFHDPVLWFGRTATPMFVTVFGITAGFVFLPKFLRGEGPALTRRLHRRSLLILFCSLLFAVPQWLKLINAHDYGHWQWLFIAYSVLLFYTIALALLPLWLRFVSRQTTVRSLLAGVALWAAGTIGYGLWPRGELSLAEFVRMLLLSGDFGYLQMMGTTLLAIPIGWRLRRVRETGSDGPFLTRLLIGGLVLSALGAGWGYALGEYDVQRIVAGDLKVPPRPWYFLHFGALALVAIAGLEFVSRGVRVLKWPMYLLALFGQVSLILFTGHVFVQPFLELLSRFTPLQGSARVAAGFVPFALFCAAVMYWRHRKQAKIAGIA